MANTKVDQVLNTWKNRGVIYTIDAQEEVGGVATAQRECATTIHTRIVPKPLTREETENLFEADLTKWQRLLYVPSIRRKKCPS